MICCKDKFAASLDKFLSRDKEVDALQSNIQYPKFKIEFTCPMHPEIVQIGHGSCPKCGMALEPKEISLDDTPDPEVR